MKLIKTLALALLLCSPLQAQKIFEKYQDNENVSFISISPKMFQFIGQLDISTDDNETQAYLKMIKSIKNFKVLISSDKAIGEEFTSHVNAMVKKQNMEILMTVRDEDTDVKFYVVPGPTESEIRRLLMYVSGVSGQELQLGKGRQVESVLLLLDGDLDLDQIALLSEKMDLPAGNQLKKIKKKQ